jgi:hypothetical protein
VALKGLPVRLLSGRAGSAVMASARYPPLRRRGLHLVRDIEAEAGQEMGKAPIRAPRPLRLVGRSAVCAEAARAVPVLSPDG